MTETTGSQHAMPLNFYVGLYVAYYAQAWRSLAREKPGINLSVGMNWMSCRMTDQHIAK